MLPVCVSGYCPGHGTVKYSARDVCTNKTADFYTRRKSAWGTVRKTIRSVMFVPSRALPISVRDLNPMCFVKNRRLYRKNPPHKYLRLITLLTRTSLHRLCLHCVSLDKEHVNLFIVATLIAICA